MNTQLIRTWEELAQFEPEWNRLWRSSGTCSREFYAYPFMRLMALHTMHHGLPRPLPVCSAISRMNEYA